MKNFIAVFFLAALQSAAWASSAPVEKFSLQCGLRRPAMMVLLKYDAKTGVTFSWMIQGGVSNLPLTNSSVSSPSIPMIQYQVEDLKNFPPIGQMHWTQDQCQSNEVGILECNGDGASPQFPFKSVRISSWQKSVRGVSNEYFSWQILWAVTTESNTYFIPFEFDESSCAAQPLP